MQTSEQLRELATQLRKEAAEVDRSKMVKCAQVLQGAKALGLLRSKVRDA